MPAPSNPPNPPNAPENDENDNMPPPGVIPMPRGPAVFGSIGVPHPHNRNQNAPAAPAELVEPEIIRGGKHRKYKSHKHVRKHKSHKHIRKHKSHKHVQKH